MIRDAKDEDLEEISNLSINLAKWESKFDRFIKISEERKKKELKWLKRKFGKLKIVVAKENKIIGYAIGEIKENQFYEKKCYIIECWVDESFRKKGIGRRLVGEIVKWAKENGAKYLEIDVYSKNPALSFWKKLGFKEICKRMRKII